MSNVTYLSLDTLFNMVGSTFYQEVIFLSLIPLGIIGTLLNIFVLVVLRDEEFRLPIHQYMRIYTFNSILICLSAATRFVSNSRRFFDFSNTITPQIYFAYFYIGFQNLIYIFGGYMDVLLSLDRFLLLSDKFKYLTRLSPNLVCSVFLLMSSIIELPYWFYFRPIEMVRKLNETEVVSIFIFVPSAFSRSLIGTVLYHINIVFMDIIPILLETITSIFTIIYLRRYVINKRRISRNSVAISNSTTTHNRLNVIRSSDRHLSRMQFRLSLLVVILSAFSILYLIFIIIYNNFYYYVCIFI
jgi:hypothetical protein